MGKYKDAQTNVFSILDGASWKLEGIKAFPVAFNGEKGEAPYIRVSIVPSGVPLNAASLSGLLLIEIFTAWDEGPDPVTRIADKLDSHFQRRTIGTTQLFNSSLDAIRQDGVNSSLAKTLYSLPFSHFGVIG